MTNGEGFVVMARGLRSVTTVSNPQRNIGNRGVTLFLVVFEVTGAPGLLLAIEAQDPATKGQRANPDLEWFTLNAAPAAVNATGITVYQLYPGATGGGINQATSLHLPDIWRVRVVNTGGAGTNATFSVGGRYGV